MERPAQDRVNFFQNIMRLSMSSDAMSELERIFNRSVDSSGGALPIFNHMVELQTAQMNSIFHALGDATRRQMLRDLAGSERTVSELAKPFSISLAAASKHIKVLENAGLIRREVRGRTHLCRLDPGPLASAHAWLSFYERFWTERLDALERLLHEDEARKASRAKNQKRRQAMNGTTTPDDYGSMIEPMTLQNPAPAARSGRAHLGLSHRQRFAPQMAGGGRDGDEGRRVLRIGLAQRRIDRSARQDPGRFRRRAPHAEPDHRVRSAAKACHHLEQHRRRHV